MNQDTNVDTVAATENTATEAPAQELPAVAAPETSETEQPDEAKTEVDPRDKAVKSLTRRVDRVTAARYQAEARAAEAEQRIQEYAQRLAQYEQPPEQNQQVNPVVLAKEIAKIERITERSNAIAGEGAKRFGDQFGNAVKMLTREAGSMFDTYGRPTGLGEAVLSADDPAAVINALGSDPDLAAEFADLSAVQQARRIARLEIELSKAPEIKHSNAPKPITPARGAASTEKSPAEMSDAEFAAWRKRQIAQRR